MPSTIAEKDTSLAKGMARSTGEKPKKIITTDTAGGEKKVDTKMSSPIRKAAEAKEGSKKPNTTIKKTTKEAEPVQEKANQA